MALLFFNVNAPIAIVKVLVASGRAIPRSGFNNTWHRGVSSEENRAQYLRDQCIHDSQLAMGHASCHGTFVHLYGKAEARDGRKMGHVNRVLG